MYEHDIVSPPSLLFQAQRPGQPPANIAPAQSARSMLENGQPEATSFPGTMDHLHGLQADGLRSQEKGQLELENEYDFTARKRSD